MPEIQIGAFCSVGAIYLQNEPLLGLLRWLLPLSKTTAVLDAYFIGKRTVSTSLLGNTEKSSMQGFALMSYLPPGRGNQQFPSKYPPSLVSHCMILSRFHIFLTVKKSSSPVETHRQQTPSEKIMTYTHKDTAAEVPRSEINLVAKINIV